MNTLTATFRIVTPMFLAGADQEKAPEIRLPSIKGALRFWYRAIDPEYRIREEALFGGTGAGAGQARFLMRLTGKIPDKHKPVGEWKRSLNYFLALVKNTREALLPGQTFTIQFTMKSTGADRDVRRDWQCLLASVWLLGHAGGLGLRSRRGFGTVALESWNVSGDDRAVDLLNQLRLCHNAESPEQWLEWFGTGLSALRGWCGKSFTNDYPHLGRGARFFVGEKPHTTWEEAMKRGMNEISSFRRHNGDAAFALGQPVIVSSGEFKFEPVGDHQRMASPVIFRVVPLRTGYAPLFVMLDAPVSKVQKYMDKNFHKRKSGQKIPKDWKKTGAPILIPPDWKERFVDQLMNKDKDPLMDEDPLNEGGFLELRREETK